jgi:hypothetical protein
MLNCIGMEGKVSFKGNWGANELVNRGSESNVTVNGNVEDPYKVTWGKLKPDLPVGSVLARGTTGAGTGAGSSGDGSGPSEPQGPTGPTIPEDGGVSVGLTY